MNGYMEDAKPSDPLLPPPNHHRVTPTARRAFPNPKLVRHLLGISLLALGCVYTLVDLGYPPTPMLPFRDRRSEFRLGSFYSSVRTQEPCPVEGKKAISHSGYVGLKGDSEESPRRSFFWFFEAQHHPEDAPLVLTHGGGPGTTGLMNPMLGQSHCVMLANGSLVPNPNAWSEKYNLLALDHPLSAGFSYGDPPNSARTAAFDIYDFLQKFYLLYPHLARNKLVLASGSYGGMYIPHTATVIHDENLALASGKGQPGAQHINLEAMMVSNPLSDTLSHFRWLLQQRCYNPIFNIYNATQCAQAYAHLPGCLDAVQYALESSPPSAEKRKQALLTCRSIQFEMNELGGRMLENVKIECDGTLEGCVPEIVAMDKYFHDNKTKEMLGIPDHIDWTSVNKTVWHEFFEEGDMVQRSEFLYGPLVSDGIRLLVNYVGALDANCGWPGIFHFLKYIDTPFLPAFLNATDLTWPANTTGVATVRAVGDKPGGAGNFTWVLMSEAGHFVTRDQPALVKNILEHWVEDRAWF